MSSETEDQVELFKGLQALSEASFPKKCSFCGRIYETVDDFTKSTEDVSGKSGLKASYDDDDSPIVELFRNCQCGSTLMDYFNERRDTSERGLKRRQLFQNILDLLDKKGLEKEKGRKELISVLKGQGSAVIESYGVRITPKKSR